MRLAMPHPLHDSLLGFPAGDGRAGRLYSLPWIEKVGFGPVGRLPVSLRIVLESLLRNCDAAKIKEEDVHRLASWRPDGARTEEVPFVVARIVLQDFTGVPLLVDLATMRSTVEQINHNPQLIEPLIPMDLIVDHSVQ